MVTCENFNCTGQCMSDKKLLTINKVKKHTMCLADKIVTFQLFHPKRTSQGNSLKNKETYWAMSHSPNNKYNGLILWNNVLQFYEVVRMEWGPWKQISKRVNTWNYSKNVWVLLLISWQEAQLTIFRQLQRKVFKSKTMTLKKPLYSGLTMGLKSYIYLFYIEFE